ncbi:sigma-54 interaction domain-containing protein [Tissierella praeacuta]|uniref:sigma-54 interaction domain-containing protein n=1 Tax=Tissierella praeacuta TaxID=43131 RepID=UPI001C1141FA|nr:sigma 54-interacting transcriptional regulator [Tissierella praeacuta]MBU5256534.1 sigma 54-interacting transcriptional regulator [Tissierella praeacuta]
MKKIVMITPGKVTSVNLAIQLESIFGEYTEVKSYCLEDELDFDFTDSLVVLSSPNTMDKRIQNLIDNGLEYIVAQRVINHRYISELLNLPRGTEVLLVNDRPESSYEAMVQLQALGVNYIKYYPYYPGITSYPELDISVTVGEPHLVPFGVKKVINIGTRQIDIVTVVDIANRLGLMKALGDRLSSQYINHIINLLNRINDTAKDMKIISSRLETVANCLGKAIIYVDKSGSVIVSNQEMGNILKSPCEEIIGRNIKDILPQIAKIDSHDEVDVVRIHNNDLFVTLKVIKGKGSEDGIIYTFEKSKDIEKNEHEIRRRTSENAIRTKYYTFDDLIYKSSNMKALIDKVKSFASTDSTILIQGESGTGKELFAQSIHSASHRSSGPFVPVNFASISTSLIESELFGYEEGSFTGAMKGGKRGLFEEAHGGTIFLDEIGDASLDFQCRLLRVIQERQVRRVGGLKEIPINVRIIAATNKDLVSEVKKGKFRADLYYRLNVLPVRMLSLKERKEDILILSNFFLKKHSMNKINNIEEILEKEAINLLYKYNWPGNIRQLENAIEYIASINRMNKKLSIKELPEYITDRGEKLEGSILTDILGENIIWMLKKIMDSNGLGRRALAELAKEEEIDLTEGKIRSLINSVEELGLVESNTGRKGTVLTEKGYNLIYSIYDIR